MAAFVILLVRLTGQNGSTILTAPAAFHRTDGGAGPVAAAQVDLDKPRRGRRRYMTATLSDLPTWAAAPAEEGELPARDELHTAFGVYLLALELTSAARRVSGGDRLLTYWVRRSAPPGGEFRDELREGAIAEWGIELNMVADPTGADPPRPLAVGVRRMRLTHIARKQRPVAHTEQVRRMCICGVTGRACPTTSAWSPTCWPARSTRPAGSARCRS